MIAELQYDRRSKIVFNCQPSRQDRLHPVTHVDQDERSRGGTHQRRISDITRIVVSNKQCRQNMILQDSKRGGLQKYHVLIDKRGQVIHTMPPDRYMMYQREYNIFLDGDFYEPIPREQKEALRYVLNAFEAICHPVPVLLEPVGRSRATSAPGPFLDQMILDIHIFQSDWSKDEETWVQK